MSPGVPAVAQQDWWWSTRTQVRAPARRSGLKALVLLQLWRRLKAYIAQVSSLVWEHHRPWGGRQRKQKSEFILD